MAKKSSLDDEQLEQTTRLALERIAAFLSTMTRSLGNVLDSWHYRFSNSDNRRDFKPSVYSPFGLLLIVVAIYYFFTIDFIFSPLEIIYFFSFIILLGIYIIRRA